jgi:hypothetical protein
VPHSRIRASSGRWTVAEQSPPPNGRKNWDVWAGARPTRLPGRPCTVGASGWPTLSLVSVSLRPTHALPGDQLQEMDRLSAHGSGR